MIRALAIVAGWVAVSVPVGMAVGWWLGGRNAHRLDCACGDAFCGGDRDY